MKKCPQCKSIYADDSLKYCLQDRTPLISDPPTPQEQQADTLILSELPTIPIKQGCPDEWLYYAAGYEIKRLEYFTLVENCTINSSYLSEGKLYVDLTFSVINLSIYKVSIPMSKGVVIEGSILFKGEPLSGTAKLFDNDIKHKNPTERGEFVIRQWVNSHEAADILDTLKKSGNLFDFSEAIVYIKGDEFPNEKAAKLDLTCGMQNARLENTLIQLENDNAQLRSEINSLKESAKYIEELTLALGVCYLAYNQLEHGELLSEESIKSVKMRISHALSHCPGSPEMLFNFFDKLPPIQDLNSVDEQKAWVDARCFEIRALIDKQRQEHTLTQESNSLPQKQS